MVESIEHELIETNPGHPDYRVAKWIRDHPGEENPEVTKDFRRWVTGFPLESVDWFELTLDVRGVIEGVMRSFRQAVTTAQSGPYRPWTRTTTKWAG